MPSVPSFTNHDELKQAVIMVFKKSKTLELSGNEQLYDFIISQLMSEKIASQAHQIRRQRQFADLVKTQASFILNRLQDYQNIGQQVLNYLNIHDQEMQSDLLSYLKEWFLTPKNSDYLLNSHTRGFVRTKIQWLLRSHAKSMRKWSSIEVAKTDQDLRDEGKDPKDFLGKKRSKKEVPIIKRQVDLGVSSEGEELDFFETFLGKSDVVIKSEDLLIEQEDQTTQQTALLAELLRLPKSRRSALISREWPVLSSWADKHLLASYVRSPLDIDQRIKVLDEIEDDQKRMVKVAYPELNDPVEEKLKLPTLNRASNHGLEALKQLYKSSMDSKDDQDE